MLVILNSDGYSLLELESNITQSQAHSHKTQKRKKSEKNSRAYQYKSESGNRIVEIKTKNFLKMKIKIFLEPWKERTNEPHSMRD